MIEVASSDIDFYERKINRLQIDIASLQEELTAARLRLRSAEDYEIKYELLLRQSQHQNQRIRMIQKDQQLRKEQYLISKLKQNEQKWQKKLQTLADQKNEKYIQKINDLITKNDSLNQKYEQLNRKSEDYELFNFKLKKQEKQKESLEEQLQDMKNYNEQQKEDEIKTIKQSLKEKNRQKIDEQRKVYQQKIEKLVHQIQQMELNRDIEPIKSHRINDKSQLQEIKQKYISRLQTHNQELESFKQALQQSNKQIEDNLNDRKILQQEFRLQKKDMKDYIKILEEKLFSKEREYTEQIINLRQRMLKVHEVKLEEMRKHQQNCVEKYEVQKNSWDKIIEGLKQEIIGIKKQYEEKLQRKFEEKQKYKQKINNLQNKLKQFDQSREQNETSQLANSLKDIDQKQDQMNTYENGIIFLERQVKKVTVKLEQKHRENKQLLQDMGRIRQETDDQLNQIKQKNKINRKELIDKIMDLEATLRDLNENLRAKEKEIRRKDKDLQSKLLELEIQNGALKDLCDELQRDYDRVIENKKVTQQFYREEMDKSINNKGDVNILKKQRWIELQKQKNQLQAIFREKEEQLKISFQIDLDHLRNQRDKYKQQSQLMGPQIIQLKKEMSLLQTDHKADKENQKFAQYQKKMATLNLEIALTQNIYDSIRNAKVRINQPISKYQSKDVQNSSFK